jgi:hypothetical protein
LQPARVAEAFDQILQSLTIRGDRHVATALP